MILFGVTLLSKIWNIRMGVRRDLELAWTLIWSPPFQFEGEGETAPSDQRSEFFLSSPLHDSCRWGFLYLSSYDISRECAIKTEIFLRCKKDFVRLIISHAFIFQKRIFKIWRIIFHHYVAKFAWYLIYFVQHLSLTYRREL